MPGKGVDPGLIADAYPAPMVLQSDQTLINWYIEVAQTKQAKMPMAMLATPGLRPIHQLAAGGATQAEVRGMWVLPGDASALVVVGQNVYVMTLSSQATATQPVSFSYEFVGSLRTNAGPVTIRDNGQAFGGEGGYAVIVDGQFGYYFAIANTTVSVPFTGTTTIGSESIAVTAVPNGLVAGPNVTVSGPGIPAGTLFQGVDFNTPSLTISQAATAAGTSTFTITIPPFGQITDQAFLPASRVAFIEGWLIFSEPNSRTFFTNAATPYTLLFDGGFYALKDSSSDNLVTLFENNRELWLVGERTTEIWYNAGGTNFSFSRVQGVAPQIGCAAVNSIARVGSQLVWLSRNEQGENQVVTNDAYNWQRLSTHAIENQIASYDVTSDALGYAYQEDGHLFYVLTFPTQDVTWCYDMTAQMWHQRLSWENNSYHRHRSNCFMNLADTRIVGDFESGWLYQMSRSYYTDGQIGPIRRQRRTANLWSNSDRKRVFQSWLQIEFTPGVGLQTGQGSTPQVMLRWSNDGGFTWSNEYWHTIGKAGETRHRCIWRRLGMARQRVYELNFIDPVPADVIGATLFLEMETPDTEEARG